MTAPTVDGLGHIDLTVTDAEASVAWWEQVMGFTLLVAAWKRPGFRGWTMVHPSGLAVTLLEHDGGDAAPFDERRVGLDHLAFRVRDHQALEAWAAHLDALGVLHSGIQDAQGPAGPLIVLRDPDNIQLELTAGWQPSTSTELEEGSRSYGAEVRSPGAVAAPAPTWTATSPLSK